MAEYKRLWAKRLKNIRNKTGLTKRDFAYEYFGILNIKKYEALEKGYASMSGYMKHRMEKIK